MGKCEQLFQEGLAALCDIQALIFRTPAIGDLVTALEQALRLWVGCPSLHERNTQSVVS